MKYISVSKVVVLLFLIVFGLIGFTVWQSARQSVQSGNLVVVKVENITIKNDLQTHGVEVVPSTDANFNSELVRLIGNYTEVIPLTEAAKPFGVLIKNNSQKEIVGVSLRWQFVKFNGEISETSQIETSPGVLLGMKPRDKFMLGKTSLINRNSLRYFTCFQSVETQILNAFKSNRSKRFNYELSPKQAEELISNVETQKLMMFNDVSSVVIIIDGGIFNDGTFIGENKTFLFESVSGMIQARKDFLEKLREVKLAEKSDTDSLNRFLSETESLFTMDQPNLNYRSGEEAFNQTYKYKMNNFINEVANKRSRMADNTILNDFLAVKDSDIIELKKGN